MLHNSKVAARNFTFVILDTIFDDCAKVNSVLNLEDLTSKK